MTTALLFAQLTIPPAGSVNGAASPARSISVAAERAVVPLVYGSTRTAALIVNVLPAAAGSATLLVQCLWAHACDGVQDLQLNDQPLPAGATTTHYNGSQSTPDAALVAAFAAQGITYADTLAGYAYSVLAMPARAFDGQLNVTGLVRGRKLYDPRKDSTAGGSGSHRLNNPATWQHSKNPALALADFCASTLYGLGSPVEWSSAATTASACDALIGSPAEARRVLDGVAFLHGVAAADVAQALRTYAGCWLLPTSGGLRLLPDADAAPVAAYSHASGGIAALGDLQRADTSRVPTAMEVLYTDASATPWRQASVTVSLPGAGSTRPWRLSQVRLPGIHRHSQARREAIERLNKLTLNNLGCALDLTDHGIRHEVGDVITVTHPIGLAALAMRVTGVTMTDLGRWRLALARHDAAAYSSDVVAGSGAIGPGLAMGGGPPADVTGLAGSVSGGVITWTWAAPIEADWTETRLRLGGSNWATAAPLWAGRGTGWLQRVDTVGSYTVRARHAQADGQESASAASHTITVTAADLAEAGGQSATVYLYQRSASATPPAGITASLTYTFATGALSVDSGSLGAWAGDVPASGGAWLWRVQALAAGTEAAAPLAPGDWGAPALLAQDGAAGAKTATVHLYQWSTAAPGAPSGTSIYTWASGEHGSYGGAAGWATAVPANPGTPGIRLWVAALAISAAAGAAATTVTWSAAASVYAASANGADGSPGAPGAKFATATLYRWALSVPTIAGSNTWTWATSDISGTLPSGWATAPGSGTPGQTLWAARVALTAGGADTISSINWGGASISAAGYAGSDGAPGGQGVSARRAYTLTTAASLGSGTVTVAGDTLPPASSVFGSGLTWAATPGTPAVGQMLYQSDGLYNPATSQTSWETPYISALKVGNLAALAVNTGALTVNGAMSVAETITVGASGIGGKIKSYGKEFASGINGFIFERLSNGTTRAEIGNGTYFLRWNTSGVLEVAGNMLVGDMQVSTGGKLRSGKSAYGSGTGWLIEYNGGAPRIDIGDADQYLRWDTTSGLQLKTASTNIVPTGPNSAALYLFAAGAQMFGSGTYTVTSRIEFRADGTIWRYTQSTSAGVSSVKIRDWYTPTTGSIGASYTLTAGNVITSGTTTPPLGAVSGSAGVLNTTRSLQLTYTGTYGNFQSGATVGYTITRNSDGAQVGSGTIDISILREV